MAGEIESLPFRDLESIIGVDKDGYAGRTLASWPNVINVKTYGAVGDGTLHPLSEKYTTLALAKAVYPRATALTESIDWHALQKAIDTAVTQGGGTVYSPKGVYKMRGPTAIRFPLYNDRFSNPVVSGSNACVNWIGDGDNLSIHHWDDDKGSTPNSEYAVMCGEIAGDPVNQQTNSRYGNNAMSGGEFYNLALVGPSRVLLPANTLDTNGCNMSGLCWAARRRLRSVRISHFYANVDVVGDHTLWVDVKLFRGYYNIYANHNSPTMYGDVVLLKCQNEEARKANFGFHYGGRLGNWRFVGRNFVGQAPYAFFKEATPATVPAGYTVQDVIVSNMKFDDIFFEGLGNAVFWDENLVANGASNSTIDNCTFNACSLTTWNNANKISGRDRCIFQVTRLNGGSISEFSRLDVTGLTRPAFDISGEIFGEFVLRGNIEKFLSDCVAAGVAPFRFASINGDLFSRRFKLEHNAGDTTSGPWKGTVYATYQGFTVDKGDFVGSSFYGVKRIGENDVTSEPMGVARTSAFPVNPPTTTSPSFVVVAESGEDIPVNTVEPASFQKLRKISATAGRLVDAMNAMDGRIVGYSGAPGRVRITSGMKSNGGLIRTDKTVTADYTLLNADHGSTIIVNSSSKVTISIASTVPKNFEVSVRRQGTGEVVFKFVTDGGFETSPASARSITAQYSETRLKVVSNTTGLKPVVSINGNVIAGPTIFTPVAMPTTNLALFFSVVRPAGYAGFFVDVRRALDGTTKSIGYTARNIPDYQAAEDFALGTALTIAKVWDASGNNNHLTYPTPANEPVWTSLTQVDGIRPITFDSHAQGAVPKMLQVTFGAALDKSSLSVYQLVNSRVSTAGNTFYEFFSDATYTSAAAASSMYYGIGSFCLNYNGTQASWFPAYPRVHMQTLSSSFSTSKVIARYDGTEKSDYAVATSGTITNLRLGRLSLNTNFHSANDVFAFAVYSAADTSATMATKEGILNTSFNTVRSGWNKRLVYGGNSIRVGFNSTLNQNALYQMGCGRPDGDMANWEVFNQAIGGRTLLNEYAQRSNMTSLYDGTKDVVVFVVGEPTNDIAGLTFTSAADAEAWATDMFGTTTGARSTTTSATVMPYIAALKATGTKARIVVLTTIARTGFDTTTNWRQTALLKYNQLVRDNAATLNYAVADNYADARLQTSTNTMYFADGIHLTNLGYSILAQIEKAAIFLAETLPAG